MDYCIVYLSSFLLPDEELFRVMQESKRKNRALGITGILLYFNGSVIEVLEGPETNVKNLYEAIQRDQRHRQLIQLYASTIEERYFPDWYMGYKALSAVEFERLKTLIQLEDNPSLQVPNKDNIILALVQLFYKNNFRN
ncbi:BLUF domain-containing protein [Spirosoma aerophilum]